jgi:1,2-dihydroxy-3-keto-5-methylthiopentene dioxygenase
MRAYYYDNLPGDQRLPHDCAPSKPVSNQTLASINVKYWTIPVDGHETEIDAIANERNYKNRDLLTVSESAMGDVSLFFWCIYYANKEVCRFMKKN